jgi:transcriptional regulator with XRE-family HTH domain
VRTSRKITQATVAQAIGTSLQHVQLTERGKANVRMTTLIAWANALDVDLAELMPGAS